MFMLWISAVGLVVAGVVLLAVGQPLVGIILAVCGVGMVALSFLLKPIMKSSREIAEQSGMEVSKLTGAPKMGSAMRNASQQMQQAQKQMVGLTGAMGGGIRRTGIAGQAMVKTAADTGEKVNGNPVYDVTLTVAPTGAASYEATVQSEVNALAIAQCVPGTTVQVKIDPDDASNMWIDWLAVAGLGGA